ncbi:MAG: IS66 family transposase [Anaerolineae bacterium]
MSAEQTPSGISAEDWAATPAAVRALVLTLLQTVAQLQQRVADLEERLGQNSRNSSKPPSSDPPNTPPHPTHTPSGRHRGAQPGHLGHQRRLKAVAHVQRVVEVKPTTCGTCGALLLGEDPDPQRQQVTELPRVEPHVTEYRRHTLTCLACGAKTPAEWPADVPAGSCGPRLQATIGYLSGRLGLSQRDIEEALDTLFHTDLSLGSVSAQEVAVSAALAQPVTDAQTYAQRQPAANLDETGWHEQSHRAWLWVAATPLVAVFVLLATRSAQGAKQLLGTTFAGVVGSDRWSAYNWLAPNHRQLCWAHLKRDFQKLVERGGESHRLGHALLAEVETLFRLWGQVKAGTLSRVEFQVKVQPLRERVQALLQEGTTVSHLQTRHLCENLLKLEVALWTFVFIEGVEPTNNHAERCLRRAVLWRRRSFGTQSVAGSLFVARILTTVTTLRQQRRDVLDYLTAACAAAISGAEPPSLLPGPSLD